MSMPATTLRRGAVDTTIGANLGSPTATRGEKDLGRGWKKITLAWATVSSGPSQGVLLASGSQSGSVTQRLGKDVAFFAVLGQIEAFHFLVLRNP